MNQLAVIGEKQIEVKEFKGKRVVTFEDIDRIHERANGTARKRFNDNQAHFIENEDYFKIQKSEKRTLGFEVPNRGLMAITETGYIMLVKSFTDDLAWKVQRQLVGIYFKGNQLSKQFELRFNELENKLQLKIEKLAEYALFNHRPSHATKLNWNRVIKNYSKCPADEENIKELAFAKFNIGKWEDLTSDRFTEVFGYIREIVEKANLTNQVSLFEKVNCEADNS